MFLYTPKDNAEGALICDRREWKLLLEILKMCPSTHLKKKDGPQMQLGAHPEPLAEGWLLHSQATWYPIL